MRTASSPRSEKIRIFAVPRRCSRLRFAAPGAGGERNSLYIRVNRSFFLSCVRSLRPHLITDAKLGKAAQSTNTAQRPEITKKCPKNTISGVGGGISSLFIAFFTGQQRKRTAQVSSAEMVQGGSRFEVETSYEALRIGLPGSDRVLNFCGFLLQQPAVRRHSERGLEFGEEMALAHVRLACSLLDGITVSEVVGHECREVLPCIEEGSEEASYLRLVGGCFEEHV